MDPRLLKALTYNRVRIVRKLSNTQSSPSEDLKLLDRCQNLSFHDTEGLIREMDQPDKDPPTRKTIWTHLLTRLFGFDH